MEVEGGFFKCLNISVGGGLWVACLVSEVISGLVMWPPPITDVKFLNTFSSDQHSLPPHLPPLTGSILSLIIC